MAETRMFYRRLHGYMCLLLLLQEFHLVILTDVNHVFSNIEHLSEKLKNQKEDLKSKVDGYISDCSVDHLIDIKHVGHVNTLPGMITRLEMALLYTIAGCGPAAREIIQTLIDHSDTDTLNEVIDVMYEILEDVENADPKQSNNPGVTEEEEDGLSSDEENTFLSGLLVENILNSAEMFNIFETLAEGDEFENKTELDNLVSELEEFSLEEILDRPNFKWIAFPSASNTNTTHIITSRLDSLVNLLNSNATERLLRELTVSIDTDENTRLLIIYHKTSHLILGVNEENLLTLTNYDETNIQRQLWVLNDGEVINVGSHSAMVTLESNVSSQVMLGNPGESSRWRHFGGYLVSSLNSDCFLDIDIHNYNASSFHYVNLSANCFPSAANVDTSIIYFTDANTPQRFMQNVEKPLSFLKSILQKVSNTKFMIFVSLLNFMIRSSVPGHGKNFKTGPEKIRLKNTFFLKNTLKPCNVLSGFVRNDTSYAIFDDFSENIIDQQLWYWKENQLINVGTGRPLEISNVKNDLGNFYDTQYRYNRLWTLENGHMYTLRNNTCQLIYDDDYDSLVLDCSGSTSSALWSFVEFDNSNFFIDVVCLFTIQTMVWPCEYLTVSDNSSDPHVYPLIDNIFSQLWYMSNGHLINADSGQALTVKNDSNSIGLGNLGNYLGMSNWTIKNEKIFSSNLNDKFVTLEMTKNGTIGLHPDHMGQTQMWKVVPLNSIANESFTCENIMDTLTPFVIRNTDMPACKLLTVIKLNDTFTIQMKHFDEEQLEFHLWVNHEGSIINIASGLSLQPNREKRIGSYSQVFSWTAARVSKRGKVANR